MMRRGKRSMLAENLAVAFLMLAGESGAEVWDREKEPFYKSPLEEVRRAAESRDRFAQKRLGDIYNEGIGVAGNPAEAAKWYERAARQGFAPAQHNLGTLFDLGRGVPANEIEAARWYRCAADQDLAQAQYSLANCYRSARGVPFDPGEAFRLMKRAAEQGLPHAQHALGQMFASAVPVPDHASAFAWYRKAATQGHVDAQNALAACFENGWGTKKNPGQALKWYEKAAAQDSVLARRRAGLMLYAGAAVRRNYRAAERHLLAVSKNLPDDVEIQFALGFIYYNGGDGIRRDVDKAALWYGAAAARGYPYAQHNLGWMCERGEGGPRNLEAAYTWYLLAAGQGLNDSFRAVGRLRPSLNPVQARRAEQLAAAFKPLTAPRPRPLLAILDLQVDPTEMASGSKYSFHLNFLATHAEDNPRVPVEVSFRIFRGAEVLFESKPVNVEAQSGVMTTFRKRDLPCRAPAGNYEFQATVRNGEIHVEKTVEFVVR